MAAGMFIFCSKIICESCKFNVIKYKLQNNKQILEKLQLFKYLSIYCKIIHLNLFTEE